MTAGDLPSIAFAIVVLFIAGALYRWERPQN